MIGQLYTIDLSESNQSAYGFLRFTINQRSGKTLVILYFLVNKIVLLYVRLGMKNLIGREHSINSQLACELDMINAISAADTAFIMSSSMSAWLLIPLECSAQKQNG